MNSQSYYDKYKRNTKAKQFYNSTAWRKMREFIYKRDDGLCQPCLELGHYTVGDIVHHKVELMDDWELRLDADNLVTVCIKCHNAIHKGDGSTTGAIPNGCMFDEFGNLIKR